MGTLYVVDQNSGKTVPIKTTDQGDGSFSIGMSFSTPVDISIPGVTQTAVSQIVTTTSGAVVVAPAAGNRIAVTSFLVQLEASGTSNAQLHFGATTTNGFRCRGVNDGDGLTITFPVGRAWKGGDAESLNITQEVNFRPWGVSLLYYTEAV